jgi:hypothetical protein
LLTRQIGGLAQREQRTPDLLRDQKIDQRAYDSKISTIRADLDAKHAELRKMETADDRIEEFVEFAEYAVNHAGELWDSAPLAGKQRFQHLLFPEGLLYEAGRVRTASLPLFFNVLQASEGQNEGMVDQRGFEPLTS